LRMEFARICRKGHFTTVANLPLTYSFPQVLLTSLPSKGT
jgi:hypothetical protein